jgi:hypothetical protein
MSQATQSLPLKHQLSAHRVLAVAALLALLATTPVVLVQTIDGGSTQTSAPAGQSSHPRTVWNGRPFGSRAVESVDSRPSAGPDESSVAAAIGSASEASPKVGEIKVSPPIRH